MKKKTYVRVITLLLAVLMILGVMAPAFTSYAASELSVINNSKDVVKVEGTPDGKDLRWGATASNSRILVWNFRCRPAPLISGPIPV